MTKTRNTVLVCVLCAVALAGCKKSTQSANVPALPPAQAQRELQGVTPQMLINEFVAEVSKLADRFPELNGFPEYARTRPSPLDVIYSRGLRPIRTKRGIRPSDFDSRGIHVQFMLRGDDNPVAAQAHQVTALPNLRLTLFADVSLAEDASDELEKELRAIIETYKALLTRLDRETASTAANAKVAQSATVDGDHQWVLTIHRDGGGFITQGHVFREGRWAHIPAGTFDFAQAQAQLEALPVCRTVRRHQITFQFGKGVPSRHFYTSDSRLISRLFEKSKEHARKGFKDLDSLWAEKPPAPSLPATHVVQRGDTLVKFVKGTHEIDKQQNLEFPLQPGDTVFVRRMH